MADTAIAEMVYTATAEFWDHEGGEQHGLVIDATHGLSTKEAARALRRKLRNRGVSIRDGVKSDNGIAAVAEETDDDGNVTVEAVEGIPATEMLVVFYTDSMPEDADWDLEPPKAAVEEEDDEEEDE